MRNINIIDPGLINLVGHHFDLNLKICKELHKLGHSINIYGALKSDPIVISKFSHYAKYHCLFRVGPYLNPLLIDPIAGGFIAFTEHSRIIANDLKSITSEGDWIFPSIFAAHVNALGMLKIHHRIFGIIHLPMEFQNAQDEMFWRYSILNSRSNCKFLNLGIIEPELFYQYQRICGDLLKIHILPIPYESNYRETTKSKLKVIGFFGHQRGEKGAEYLEKLSFKLADLNFSIILHNCDSFNSHPAHRNITKYGFVDNLENLISNCDCIVLPYSMKQYKYKGSGVLYDGLSIGVPVVGPIDTSIARWIQKSGSGVLYHGESMESIIKAIQYLKTHYAKIYQNSIDFKIKWHDENGTDKFINCILNT